MRVGAPGRCLFIGVQPEKHNVGVGMGHVEGFIVRDLVPGMALDNLGGLARQVGGLWVGWAPGGQAGALWKSFFRERILSSTLTVLTLVSQVHLHYPEQVHPT